MPRRPSPTMLTQEEWAAQDKKFRDPATGEMLPGHPGRCPGIPNKKTRDRADLANAILEAFDNLGGKEYLTTLAGDDGRAFVALLSKCVPRESQLSIIQDAALPVLTGADLAILTEICTDRIKQGKALPECLARVRTMEGGDCVDLHDAARRMLEIGDSVPMVVDVDVHEVEEPEK